MTMWNCDKCLGTPGFGAGCVCPRPAAEDSAKGAGDVVLPPIKIGSLPTMNQEDYPGLGDWWVQLRIGPDNNEVLARVYGDSPEHAVARAKALADRQQRGGDVDERVAFELWYTRYDTPDMAARAVQRDSSGQYRLGNARSSWEVWQARAALAANKADDARDAERYRLIRDLGASFSDYEDREYRVCEDAMDATLDRIRVAIAQQGKEGA